VAERSLSTAVISPRGASCEQLGDQGAGISKDAARQPRKIHRQVITLPFTLLL